MSTPQLHPHHLEDLRASGLSAEDAARYGIRSATRAEGKRILGFDPGSDGLFFSAPSLNGGGPSYQFKPDRPFLDAEGRAVKYLSAKGGGNHLQVPEDLLENGVLRDANITLLLTEGRKKALAATKAGFPCLSLSGVWCWRCAGKDGQSGPIPDLDVVAWKGRRVFLCYDSDAATKPEVRQAEAALAAELQRRGAVVKVVRLPGGPDGAKLGLDDFLVAKGPAALRELLERAEEPEEPATRKSYRKTDLGNAERLAAQHGRDLRYSYEKGTWYGWDGRRWLLDTGGEVERRAKQTVRTIYREAEREEEEERRKALAQHATRSEGRARIDAMIALGQSEQGIPVQQAELDKDPWALNVLNGCVDLRTSELRPHRREDLITRLIEVEYDPAAKCPLREEFLRDIMAGDLELMAFLRRAAGYSLTGSTREQAFFLLHGTGSNGKSTFLETISTLLGDYAHTAEFSSFLKRRGESVRTDIADLKGRRFVTAIEADPGRRLDESLVKALTGGDTINARHLYERAFQFAPEFKLWLAANHKPEIRGQDYAIWRRVRLIPFEVVVPPERQDKDLPAKLREELPGILAWAVRGCLEWLAGGLGEPERVKAATAEYREESDILADFLASTCREEHGSQVAASDLYARYRTWCEGNGEREFSQTAFGRMLAERGFRRKRNASGRSVYQGLSLSSA